MSNLRLMLGILLTVCSAVCLASNLEIKVKLLPEHSGAIVPVMVKVDAARMEGVDPALYCMKDTSSPRRLPFQYDKATGTLEFAVDVPEITKPTTKTFRLVREYPIYGDGLWVDSEESGSLIVRQGDLQIFVYNYASMLPAGVPEQYRRSCYIHPVFGPLGEMLTDDFPKDHYHHRGLSVMWTHVVVGGKDHDLWALNGMKPRFSKVLAMEDGPVYSLLKVNDGWYTSDCVRVVDETWTVKTYASGEYGRIVDLDILLKAVDQPVSVKSSDRGYGGLQVRFAPRENTVLFSEKGRVPQDTDKEPFLWNDLSAKFQGAEDVTGLAIFDNPGNVRHPQPWTNRYYGVLNPAPAAIEPITITKDQPLHLRYRVWIHIGDVQSGRVAQAYQAYAHPPVVEVSSQR